MYLNAFFVKVQLTKHWETFDQIYRCSLDPGIKVKSSVDDFNLHIRSKSKLIKQIVFIKTIKL